MSLYTALKNLWKKPKASVGKLAWRDKIVELRKQTAITKLDRPTRLDRARSLGYKAKQGIIVVRSRVPKGITKRPKVKGGRRPKRYGRVRLPVQKSKQRIAEERASRKYPNMEVLNSYWLAKDGKYEWFEIILVDPDSPRIKSDKDLKWIGEKQHKRRVFRGKTSAGKKGRGLRK